MPVWSIRLVRTALVYLVLGSLAGAVMLSAMARGVAVPLGAVRALHAELILFGWLVQFAMGVAWWILPRHAAGPPRGPAWSVVLTWVLLNAGVWLAGLGQALLWPPETVLLGRTAEAAAVLSFAAGAAPRIKAFGAGR